MKKFSFSGIVLLLIVLAFPPAVQAAGRLNFMLTNLSGEEITSVRISPTSYPGAITENLLNTTLLPSSRIYIGPNYYGHQYYWDIHITWASGYTHLFRYSQLTRYNSYVVYSGAYGLKMRQGYEYEFARAGYGAPRYVIPYGDADVAVGVPEQVNYRYVASYSHGPLAQSSRKTRDLVFEDEDDATAKPTVSGSTADAVKGESIAVKTTVELTRNGKVSTVLPAEEFKSGDKVRLLFSASRDGYVYWVAKGTSGQYQVLFPGAKAGMDNAVAKNKEYTVPFKGTFRFDDTKGTETLVCILSPSKVAELDKAVALAEANKKQEASDVIAPVVAAHESKRTTRDLVFEEENENDVNTKTQVSADNSPFVATYDLVHN